MWMIMGYADDGKGSLPTKYCYVTLVEVHCVFCMCSCVCVVSMCVHVCVYIHYITHYKHNLPRGKLSITKQKPFTLTSLLFYQQHTQCHDKQ